ncbi:Hint domain-containing protein [Sulfitobacter aestuarii]|uniref:Hint domain-containing protein n=1 Tax=Sulfitobacter aestuarii TaxID=2161676 RepID=A0ABW5U5R5_9RHOB
MSRYIIVAKGTKPLGPNEIHAGSTIEVKDGDVFVVSASADKEVTFVSGDGAAKDFSVEFNESNDNNFNVKFGENLSPNISIADNVDLSDISLDADKSAGIALEIGNNAKLQKIFGSKDGDDRILIGDNFNSGDIQLGNGDNLLRIGDNANLHNLHSGTGNDRISIGDNAEIHNIHTGKGDDELRIGDNFTGKNIKTEHGNDTVWIGENADVNKVDGGKDHDVLNSKTQNLDRKHFEEYDTVCFVRGTRIATAEGEVAIEDLQVGDLIQTVDHGLQPIRWIAGSRVRGVSHLAPVLIRAGALGNRRDLLVSPQHRMMLRGWRAELHFGIVEVLVPAKHLINDSTIRQVDTAEVEYFHMLFDQHEIVFAEGVESESFHPGAIGMGNVDDLAREEIFALFPQLRADLDSYGGSARGSLKAHEALLLRPTTTAA